MIQLDEDGTATPTVPDSERDARQVSVIFGALLKNNSGTGRSLGFGDFIRELNEHVGTEAWVVGSTCRDAVRRDEECEHSDIVFVDVDPTTKSASGEKPLLTDAQKTLLIHEVEHVLRPTFYYFTAHAIRLGWVLTEPCRAGARFVEIATHLCDRVDSCLRERLPLHVDRKASCNRVQLYYSPRATVDGKQRNGVAVAVAGLLDATTIPSTPTEERPSSITGSQAPTANGAQPIGGKRAHATFAEARDAYRTANPLDAPVNSGECPACLRRGCFGRLPGSKTQWFCFSTNHGADSGGVGVATKNGFLGDQLDLDAHAAGLSPAAFLKRDGWLDPAAAFDAVANGDPLVGTSPGDVLARMQSAGPRLHLVTPFPSLNQATGGGPPTGIVAPLLGQPDSGKTAAGNQLCDHFASNGIPCGVLSVDEIDADQLTRCLQRRGFTREEVESADPAAIDAMRQQVADLPVRFYGPDVLIEQAAADIRALQQRMNAPAAVLFVDSIQTARCAASADAKSRYEQITANVAAMRDVALRYGLLVIAASEKNRGGYAHPDKRVDDMAAGSGSSAIEYQARLLLSLDSVPGSPDLVELRIIKNKFGPRTRSDQQGIVLRLDRARQTLTEVSGVVVPDRATAKQATRLRASTTDAALLAIALLEKPGESLSKVEDRTRAEKAHRKLGGLPHSSFDHAKALLGGAVVDEGTANRARLRLDPARLSSEVLATIDQLDKGGLVDAGARAAIAAAQPVETPETFTPVRGADDDDQGAA